MPNYWTWIILIVSRAEAIIKILQQGIVFSDHRTVPIIDTKILDSINYKYM